MDEVPELRFARARSGRLAYQQWGEGDHLVGVPPLAQNIELAWGWPDVVAMFERFGRMSTYTHYDKRGTGASDRLHEPPGLDERVDDMRAVMDDAGIDRAHLLGNSDGGPTALLFAATYPERVRSVVLCGSGASIFEPTTQSSTAQLLVFKASAVAMSTAWGTRLSPFVDHFAPSLAGDQAFRRWHQRYERACCDSRTLYDLLLMSWGTDVRGVLDEVRCPVLVLHRRGDRVVSVDRAREVAELLHDATLVELDGDDHLGYAGDTDALCDEMERWITGRVATPSAPPRTVQARIVTLGGFAVVRGGEEVPTSEWGSRHARTILKRLAVARGWPVTRDELFEMLWPGETDRRKVGARLSVQLSTVRRVLGGGVIADRETVRLDLSEVDLDLATFDEAEDDGAVLAAHTGTFLPEDVGESWTAATRAEVDTRFAAAGAREADRALEHGFPGRAAEIARRLIDANALDLTAHELLVTALLDTDNLPAAELAHHRWTEAAHALGTHVPPLTPS